MADGEGEDDDDKEGNLRTRLILAHANSNWNSLTFWRKVATSVAISFMFFFVSIPKLSYPRSILSIELVGRKRTWELLNTKEYWTLAAFLSHDFLSFGGKSSLTWSQVLRQSYKSNGPAEIISTRANALQQEHYARQEVMTFPIWYTFGFFKSKSSFLPLSYLTFLDCGERAMKL